MILRMAASWASVGVPVVEAAVQVPYGRAVRASWRARAHQVSWSSVIVTAASQVAFGLGQEPSMAKSSQ
jgi:hypothetical protein